MAGFYGGTAFAQALGYVTRASLGFHVVAGASGGFIAGAIIGGTPEAAFYGGISGGFAGLIGHYGAALGAFKPLAHGLSQGLTTRLQGGSFQTGLLSGVFTSAAQGAIAGIRTPNGFLNLAARTTASAVVGGTAAVIGGGRFANGARTGAFIFAFNECASGRCWASSKDLDAYKAGGPHGLMKSMCDGGDPFACLAKDVTANSPLTPSGVLAKGWLASSYQAAHATQWGMMPDGTPVPLNGQMTPEIMGQYSRDVADAYVKYLGTDPLRGQWPSWESINKLHWDVNKRYGLGPSAYGGTPFGKASPNMMKGVLCPECGP